MPHTALVVLETGVIRVDTDRNWALGGNSGLHGLFVTIGQVVPSFSRRTDIGRVESARSDL